MLLSFCTTLLILISSRPGVAVQQNVLSTVDDIAGDLKDVPCKPKERLQAVRAQFLKMGAGESDITTQKFRGAENLVVRRSGPAEDTIVIGAHYDFIDAGCGAIDNWSGIVAMSRVYKSVRALEQKKTVLFVAFDNEEKGLIGAKAMADAIPKDQLSRYCAMINIDSFGLAQPFAMANTSTPSLMKTAAAAAAAMNLQLQTAPIADADADSSAFLAKKIPAITLAGVSDNWPSILHSYNDQKERIDVRGVYFGYRVALALWQRVDQAPCDAFRG